MTNLDKWFAATPWKVRKVNITQFIDDDGVIVELLEYQSAAGGGEWERVGFKGGSTISRAVFLALKEAQGHD